MVAVVRRGDRVGLVAGFELVSGTVPDRVPGWRLRRSYLGITVRGSNSENGPDEPVIDHHFHGGIGVRGDVESGRYQPLVHGLRRIPYHFRKVRPRNGVPVVGVPCRVPRRLGYLPSGRRVVAVRTPGFSENLVVKPGHAYRFVSVYIRSEVVRALCRVRAVPDIHVGVLCSRIVEVVHDDLQVVGTARDVYPVIIPRSVLDAPGKNLASRYGLCVAAAVVTDPDSRRIGRC